ncbi:methyltransferase [Legionella spiritensis]|uniref:Methyltransferase n=1 Tax=Legionella spiritensis TaxID=452 RepID=A0A0W0Z5V6_LEGSP|nr:methyltransferase [Legionella spiritensis]KTD64540.1 methyltransferase [Legionella spiritensis]SNV29869.1 methyltransferase [Legionella spiritensis]
MTWLKKWFSKQSNDEHQNASTAITPPPEKKQYNSRFYANYFSLIADGARLKLVEAMFRLNLFDLFEHKTCVSEQEIIEKLALMPIRAKKWLHLLCSEHFLIKVSNQNHQPAYQLPEEFQRLIRSDGWWAMKFFYNIWAVTANENLTGVLRYGKIKTTAPWPPKSAQQAVWLEEWMTKTADITTQCILDNLDFNKVTNILDVGGGEGTMACAFASAHPHLKAAVYNLPISAEMARKKIASHGLSHRIDVIEGNFITNDSFPLGFDCILFARVLFDWNEHHNRKLLRMAYLALKKGGLVAICETLKDDNNDLCLSCEYRHIFNDDFDAHVMKTEAEYRNMLEEIGFTLLPAKKERHGYCTLLLARK